MENFRENYNPLEVPTPLVGCWVDGWFGMIAEKAFCLSINPFVEE